MDKTAITINETIIDKYQLKSMDHARNFLKMAYDIETLVITAERTQTSKNIHYHILAAAITEQQERELWHDKIYNSKIDNELNYYNYIIKDGNIKLYDYTPPIVPKSTSTYEAMLNDIYENDFSFDMIRIKYPELFVKHYQTITKMLMDSNFTKSMTKKKG